MKDRLRILVIDDSAVQLDSVAHALEGEGYDVRTASDLETALAVVAKCDLAIVDFHMPGSSGDRVARELRSALPAPAPAEARPLFYLYTSDAQVAISYKSYGFDGAFTRKGSVEELISQVRTTEKILRMRRFVKKTHRPG